MLKKVEKKTDKAERKSKSIFRITKNKDNPYVMLNKEPLNDEKLSWKAKGVLAYLLSLPDDWQIYEEEVQKHSKDGLDSLRSGIKELIENGYIERARIRDEKGMLRGYEYSVYEVSIQMGKSKTGKSKNGKSKTGKSQATNNNLTNNNLTDDDDITPCVQDIYLNNFKGTKTTMNTLDDLISNYGHALVLEIINRMIDIKEDGGEIKTPLKYLKDSLAYEVKPKEVKKKTSIKSIIQKQRAEKEGNKLNFNNFEAREMYSDESEMKSLEKKLLGWDK